MFEELAYFSYIFRLIVKKDFSNNLTMYNELLSNFHFYAYIYP